MDPKLFLITYLCMCVSAEWDCMTYQGSKGQCVVLSDCYSLKSKLMESQRNKNVYETLNRDKCGFEGNEPKVCCPDGNELNENICITPDGHEGTCTKLQDCSYITDKLRNKDFVLAENMGLMGSTNCTPPGSSTSFYVCCRSPDSRSSQPGTPFVNLVHQNRCPLFAFPPEPDSKCCGIESSSEPRIVGGKEAGIDNFPWLAMIDYTRIGYSCGGSLISGRYVLTAAHCLVGSQGKDRKAVSVRLGEYNTTNSGKDCVEAAGGGDDCTDGHITIPIEGYVVHEDYQADNVLQYNDIALIRLKETVNYTDFIRPICLPTTDFTKPSPEDLSLFIAGWGIFDERQQQTSEVKLYAKVPYVKKEQCNDRYLKLGKQSLLDTQLCVGGEENRDSCKGDSGGPLMLMQNLTYEAVGVISFGTKSCGLENWPSIYTKVYDYLDWIKAKIKLGESGIRKTVE